MSFKILGDSRFCEGGTYRVVSPTGTTPVRRAPKPQPPAPTEAEKMTVIHETAALQPPVSRQPALAKAPSPAPTQTVARPAPSIWDWLQNLFTFTGDRWASYAKQRPIAKPPRPPFRLPGTLAKTQQMETAKPHTKPSAIGIPKSKYRIQTIKPAKITPTLTGLTKLLED